MLESLWNEPIEIKINDFIQNIDSLRLQVSVGDRLPEGHLVEGGIDAFSVKEQNTTTPTIEISKTLHLSVIPNPVSDVITIEMKKDANPTKIQIAGLNGVMWRMPYETSSIDVSALPSGIYQISVWTDKSLYSNRFVKI